MISPQLKRILKELKRLYKPRACPKKRRLKQSEEFNS
jgi:hypothetical protein